MDALHIDNELRWEARMASKGYTEAMQSEVKGGLKTSQTGTSLKAKLTKVLIKRFEEFALSIATGDRKMANASVAAPFLALSEEEIAFITVRAILELPKANGEEEEIGLSYRRVCSTVGDGLLTQIAYTRMVGDSETDQKLLALMKYSKRSRKGTWLFQKALKEAVNADKPSKDIVLRIGAEALEQVLAQFPKLFQKVSVRRSKGVKTEFRVVYTDAFWKLVQSMREDIATSQPYLTPTIMSPKDWHTARDGEPTMGGYYLLDHPLVKCGVWKHTNADMTGVSQASLDALNHAQSTPWMVNQFVADVALKAVVDEQSLNGLLPLLETRTPTTGLTGSDLRRAIEDNESLQGQHGEMRRQLGASITLRNRGAFWFPHNFDWRLRMYPLPFDLHPQGNDLSRGLLMFANGVPITKQGIYWLGVYIASLAGNDKLPFNDRMTWTQENHEAIYAAGHEPMDDLWWTELDEPWQFLAAAREWYLLSNEENPERFITHLPVQQDGSCNGMQHFSMMARDELGAQATNCRPSETLNDLYLQVADRVREEMYRDLSNGSSEAALWLPKFEDMGQRRKIVKRAVMTTPYGVTNRGITQFMITDRHVAEFAADERLPAAIYMTGKITAAIDAAMSKGREVQGYFSRVAGALAKDNVPLMWRTPAGSVCIQKYSDLQVIRVITAGGVLRLNGEIEQGALNSSKMAQSASPNVVHSCDAAHLQLTVNAMHEAGIRSFSMIHDSYGTHAANIDLMRSLLREQAYGMYKGNYLKTWAASVEALTGVPVEPPPALGNWDVSEVLQAEYMFA